MKSLRFLIVLLVNDSGFMPVTDEMVIKKN